MQSARRRDRLPSGRTNLQQAGANALEFSPIVNRQQQQQQEHQQQQQQLRQEQNQGPNTGRNNNSENQGDHPSYVRTPGRGNTGRTEISSLYTSPSKSIFGQSPSRGPHPGNNRSRTNRTKRSMFDADREVVSLTNEPKKIKQVARALDRSEFEDTAIITERSIPVAKHAVAQQFFNTIEQRGQYSDMGMGLNERGTDGNVELMMQSDFTRSLRALKYRQRVIDGKGSRQMQGCLSFERIPEVGDEAYLRKLKEQYKPYAAPSEKSSNVRNFHELKQKRIQDSIAEGDKWRARIKGGPPAGVSFKRVSAFKNEDIDR